MTTDYELSVNQMRTKKWEICTFNSTRYEEYSFYRRPTNVDSDRKYREVIKIEMMKSIRILFNFICIFISEVILYVHDKLIRLPLKTFPRVIRFYVKKC